MKASTIFAKSCAIVITLFTTLTAYAHDFELNGIFYNIIDDESKTVGVTFEGNSYFSKSYSGDVTIPQNVTYSETEYTVTSINSYAFYSCPELTSITIPEGVTNIGTNAFFSCSALADIKIPNSVNYIGQSTFYGTAWYNNQPDGVVYAGKVLYMYKGTMPENTTINVADGTTAIGYNAFKECTNLISITLPNSIINIEEGAFKECHFLTDIVIPDNVKTIGDYAFEHCNNFKSVDIPGSVTSIGSYAFFNCQGLTDITTGNGVETIGMHAFESCIKLANVTMGNSVTTIGEEAFDGCSSIANITLPNSLTTINSNAFANCTGLKSITIPNSVTSMGSGVFERCTGLTSATIGNNLTSIANYTFSGCSALTSITIPKSVTFISYNAFNGCTSLSSVTSLAATAPSLSSDVFANIASDATLRYPAGSDYSAWEQYFAKSETFATNIAEGTCGDSVYWVFDVATGTLTISGSGAMYNYPHADSIPWKDLKENISSIIIEEGVTSISDYSFYGYESICDATIQNGITTIGKYAFAGCHGIKSIILPDCVNSIGDGAFSECTSLSRINIPEGVTNIAHYTFGGCCGLTEIILPGSVKTIGSIAFFACTELKNVTIPNGATKIEDGAFMSCGLTSLTIPSSVTSIGNDAFNACYKITGITSNISADSLFALTENAFSGVDKDSCTLYVPYGAKATYAATDGWNEFTNIVEMESTTPVTISVDSISTTPGRSITLPFGMTNKGGITAFQIDIEVPEGIEFVSAALSDERKTTTHYLNTSVLANGKRRIIAYSNNNTPFKLNEGTLLNINLDVPKEAENGDYGVNISNIRLVKPDSKEILLDPISANINVKLLMGDANDDNDVTMGDVVSVANYILELLFGAFNFDAADINGDGEITMGDLVAIINIILYPEDYDYGRNAKRGVMAASGTEISLPDTRSTDEAVSVPVSLSSTMAYTAFQMDIELPEGAKLTSAALTERAVAHSIAWSSLPDGKMRVVAYSLDNEAFSGNAGELVALNIEAEGAVSGAISVENVRMVTPSGDEYAIGNCGSLLDINGTTGINGTEVGNLKVYTADGALIVESGKAMKAAVYSVSGKLVKTLDVAEGKNIYEALPAGTYVVAGVKVAIK